MNKVIIIGSGNVGMSFAYALCNQRTKVDELDIIDVNIDKAEGEVLDLNHALAFAPSRLKIKLGNYNDCDNAKIIVICAGKNQEIGETRNDLISKNFDVFKNIITQIKQTKFNGIIVVATNPLDIMTLITYKLSGLTPNKVFGSGTTLDTARLRVLVANKLNISSKNVHGYVLGEHGDSEFVSWENITIGVNKAEKYLTKKQMNEIENDVRTSAYRIIKKKGNTSYGIGMCLVKIINSILDNDNSIMTVSSYLPEHDIYIGMPTVINKNGAVRQISIDLSEISMKKYINSINTIKAFREQLKI